MEDKITIDLLVQEHCSRIGSLRAYSNIFTYYEYDDMQLYKNWVAKTIRFLELNYQNDKHISDFITISEKKLTPEQQQQLLAILKAFAYFPTIIEAKKEYDDKSINVNTNINNSNIQSMVIDIFIEAIKDDLTGRQIKELKQIVEEENDDIEKAKPKLIEKLMSFGKDVASNIVANLLTNPSIWNGLI